MKILKRILVAANSLALCASIATPVFARQTLPNTHANTQEIQNPGWPMMMGGWHYKSPYGGMFFNGTPISLDGTIVEFSTFVPQPRMMSGNLIVLKTEKGNRTIHLGPRWYIREQNLELKVGDRISVQGNQVNQGKTEIVFASKITKGQQTWILRDPEGIPNWCAQRPAAPQNGKENSSQDADKK